MTTPTRLMAALVLVALVGGATAMDPGARDQGGYAPTLSDVKSALYDLSYAIGRDFAIQSDAALLLSAAGERINFVNDERVPSLTTSNEQQAAITKTLAGQICALEEMGDGLVSLMSRATLTADDVNITASELRDFLDSTISVNMNQNDAIAELREKLPNVTWALETLVMETVDGVDEAVGDLTQFIHQVNDFVDSRKCEIGTASIPPGSYDVEFKVAFDGVPDVTLGTSGFGLRLDAGYSSKERYDHVALDKHVHDVTSTGFKVTAVDESVGMVMVETFYCVYMACENLDRDFPTGY